MRRATAALAIAAVACSRGRPPLPILTYHSISQAPGRFTVEPAGFARQLDALAQAGFHTITVHDWLAHEDGGAPLPANPIILTFDDGHEDAYTAVLPALRSRGMRASFFIVTSLVGEDEAHRRVREEQGATSRYLVWPEVRALAGAGMEIGSHGATHERLADLDRPGAARELRESKERIEAVLGSPVEVFAYPYNSVRSWIEPLVRAQGYRAALAGAAHGGAGRFALQRIGVYRDTTAEAVVSEASKLRRR